MAELDAVEILAVPEKDIEDSRQNIGLDRWGTGSTRLHEHNLASKVRFPEHLIQHRPNAMHVLIPDLDKDAPALRQQITCHRKPSRRYVRYE